MGKLHEVTVQGGACLYDLWSSFFCVPVVNRPFSQSPQERRGYAKRTKSRIDILRDKSHSNSIVPGGLLVTVYQVSLFIQTIHIHPSKGDSLSSNTLQTPSTSFTILVLTLCLNS